MTLARAISPLALLGGTFDPIHFGHLRTALEVREALGLDEVRFTPCRQPPHRVAVASPEARVKMLELALAGAADFVLDTRELRRPGPSWMIDTLAALRAELGAATPLCLILGHDAFLGLPGWHRWRELPDLSHLVVMTRLGAKPQWPEELATHLNGRVVDGPDRLRAAPCGSVRFQPVTALDISASRIRVLLRTGRSARYLLPDAVLDFIQSSGLYLPESPNPGESACIPSLNP